MTTITHPNPFNQNQPETLTYHNSSVYAAAYEAYVLKNSSPKV